MSHLVKQKNENGVEIKDLDLLSKACDKMGITLHKDRKLAHYYGASTAKCDAVITIPGCTSEIPVFHRNGQYEIEADHYYSDVTKAIGKNSDMLFQRYRAEELKKVAKYENWSVSSEKVNEATGELELKFTRG